MFATPATWPTVVTAWRPNWRKNARRAGVVVGSLRGRRCGVRGLVGCLPSRPAADPTGRSAPVDWPATRVRQYPMTLLMRWPSSRSRPLRKPSSTRKERPTISPLSWSDELDRAQDGAARGEQVVHDEHPLAGG